MEATRWKADAFGSKRRTPKRNGATHVRTEHAVAPTAHSTQCLKSHGEYNARTPVETTATPNAQLYTKHPSAQQRRGKK